VRSEAKPEERKTFFGGGNEKESLEPGALAIVSQGCAGFFDSRGLFEPEPIRGGRGIGSLPDSVKATSLRLKLFPLTAAISAKKSVPSFYADRI
jgi:hypothetical protein